MGGGSCTIGEGRHRAYQSEKRRAWRGVKTVTLKARRRGAKRQRIKKEGMKKKKKKSMARQK